MPGTYKSSVIEAPIQRVRDSIRDLKQHLRQP